MTITLAVKSRDTKEKLDAVRKAGFIPAVFYGGGVKNTPVAISKKDFTKVFKDAGESTVISLKTDQGEEDSLIQEVQSDPVTGEVLHIDFKILEKGKAVKVHVSLEFIGESPAVKGGLGVFTKNLNEIEIEALPKDLPQNIEVDISSLGNVGDQILVEALKLPSGVTSLTKGEEVVALITAVKEEKEEVVAPIDMAAIETVDQKGKKPEEGAEATAGEVPPAKKEEAKK